MIRAVIFDMDGVLVDSEPLWQQAIIDSFHSIGIPLSQQEAVQSQGMRVDALVAILHQRYEWKSPSQHDVTHLILDTVVALINEQGKAKAGAQSALAFVSGKVDLLGLASSSPRQVIQAVINRLDLADTFDIIHSAEHEPYGKPHPAVYLTAADKLNVPPADCLAGEDSFSGLLSASAAGMTCVCVPDPAFQGDPRLALADVVIPTLEAFDDTLWERVTNPRNVSSAPQTMPIFPDLRGQVLEEINQTLAAVDAAQVAQLVQQIAAHRRIFVAGKGRSGLHMGAFAMRLAQMGLAVHVVGEITAPAIQAGDVLLIGSASGTTAPLVDYAARARAVDAGVCLLTANRESPLIEASDYHLIIPTRSAGKDSPGVESVQPLGTRFETCLGILLDVMVMQVMADLGVSAGQMADRHANLE